MSNYIDGYSCKLQFCTYCQKIVNKSIRGRKKTCSDECAVLYQRQVWNRQYAENMANDPDYAKKQSAKQYQRIKSDPAKLQAHQEAQKFRKQLPNYIESDKKSQKKYRSSDRYKALNSKRMRKYRDENPENIAKIEARRQIKKSEERERLKREDPEKYQQLLSREAEYLRNLRSEKRLNELQKDLSKLVNDNE